MAILYRAGWFETEGGEYREAELGSVYYGVSAGDFVCRLIGIMPWQAEGPVCPDCDWAFDLGPVQASVTDGEACEALRVDSGALDGQFDYTWGFASSWGDYGPALLVYDGGWFVFQSGEELVGDAASLSFTEPVPSESGGYSYYSY